MGGKRSRSPQGKSRGGERTPACRKGGFGDLPFSRRSRGPPRRIDPLRRARAPHARVHSDASARPSPRLPLAYPSVTLVLCRLENRGKLHRMLPSPVSVFPTSATRPSPYRPSPSLPLVKKRQSRSFGVCERAITDEQ